MWRTTSSTSGNNDASVSEFGKSFASTSYNQIDSATAAILPSHAVTNNPFVEGHSFHLPEYGSPDFFRVFAVTEVRTPADLFGRSSNSLPNSMLPSMISVLPPPNYLLSTDDTTPFEPLGPFAPISIDSSPDQPENQDYGPLDDGTESQDDRELVLQDEGHIHPTSWSPFNPLSLPPLQNILPSVSLSPTPGVTGPFHRRPEQEMWMHSPPLSESDILLNFPSERKHHHSIEHESATITTAPGAPEATTHEDPTSKEPPSKKARSIQNA